MAASNGACGNGVRRLLSSVGLAFSRALKPVVANQPGMQRARIRGAGAYFFAALGVLAATATGCAASSGGLVVSGSSSKTYERTIGARTARVVVDLQVDAPRSRSYVLAEGEVELSTSSCALSVLETGTTVRELLAGGDLYFELPAFARTTTNGKPWAEVALRSGREVGPGWPRPHP